MTPDTITEGGPIMADITVNPTRKPRGSRKTLEYRIYRAIGMCIALPIAAIRRLLPREIDAPARRSVVAEARAMTDTVVPYIFMA